MPLTSRSRVVVAFTIGALLTGCGSPAYDEPITGPYRLVAADVMRQLSVARRTGHGDGAVVCIDETVYAVGWDSRYIVAKQHPAGDRAAIHYYILDMSRGGDHVDPKEGVTGPLTETEFNQRKVELRLPDFKTTFEDLE